MNSLGFVYHFRAKDDTVQEGPTDNFEKKDVKTYKSKRVRKNNFGSDDSDDSADEGNNMPMPPAASPVKKHATKKVSVHC